ncbi:MAG: hypothetical protein JRH20_11580 [Deltaproteobacteria bacterium]|nr:hypothetical protein [Deltaproteobacteria bacterium]
MRGSIIIMLALIAPLPAAAQEILPEVERYHSPQRFALELKLGPFIPDIDGEFSGNSPYEDILGSDPGLMFQTEFDFQVWRGFGSIGVGGSIGYFTKGGAPFADDSVDGAPASGNITVAGETSITLVPLSLLAVYRFDVLAQRYNIPLVPYIKLGLSYTFWFMDKGDGSIASYEGDDAEGGSLGWQINLGVALLLDVFEPQSAKTLDMDLGVNHTYIFIELYHLDANGFSGETALNVGDTSFLAGLAIEF